MLGTVEGSKDDGHSLIENVVHMENKEKVGHKEKTMDEDTTSEESRLRVRGFPGD